MLAGRSAVSRRAAWKITFRSEATAFISIVFRASLSMRILVRYSGKCLMHVTFPETVRTLRRIPPEAAIWAAGLVALACTGPNAEGLFGLCLFKAMGFSFCPGCGLGHAVAHLFRGDFMLSFQAHPLGVFAVGMLGHRIVTLSRLAVLGGTPAAADSPLPN